MLVTIITPTTLSRANFMPRLQAMVSFQDYPHIEHLIDYDSGTVGAKRNRLCEQAKGEIILHMDSDDIYANDWVSKSVAALGDADITGLSGLYFMKPDSKEAWLYQYPADEKLPFVAGATMCYRKSFWERNKFPDMQVGEDNKFMWDAKDCIVKPHDYINGFLSIIHGDCTSQKPTSHRYFVPGGVKEVMELMPFSASYIPAA